MTSPIVYLDNNATTQVAPEVVVAMQPFFTEHWGNPSSMHAFGGRVAADVEKARAQVASFLGCAPAEIVFTSCATESDNAAINGIVETLGPQTRIITSRVEHPAVLGPCRHLREKGHQVVEIGVDSQGRFDMEAFRRELAASSAPTLVTIMWANNETGVLFPIDEIARLAKAAGAIVHTDAVQVMGKYPVNLSQTPVDLLSLSGHKFHAPKGIGVLFVRKGTRLRTWMIGGHQERGRRGGTENVPYIVGLGKACELAAQDIAAGDLQRIGRLRDRLEQGLLATCPDARVNGAPELRLPTTLNISFEYIEGEAMIYRLSDAGICASTGSACAAGSLEPSHVIRAMGVPFTAVHGSIRFSLSRYTTDSDIDSVLREMPRIVADLRAMSPFVK